MGTDLKQIITLFQVILNILTDIDHLSLLLHSELRTEISIRNELITMFVIGSSLQVFLHKMFYYHKFCVETIIIQIEIQNYIMHKKCVETIISIC